MKVLGTIVLSFVVILAGLVLCLSTTCAVSSGMTARDRIVFAFCAAVALGFLIGAIKLIKKLNR